jgi:hypothetical protein
VTYDLRALSCFITAVSSGSVLDILRTWNIVFRGLEIGDMRFLQWFWWRLRSPGMLCHVTWWIITYVLEERNFSVCRQAVRKVLFYMWWSKEFFVCNDILLRSCKICAQNLLKSWMFNYSYATPMGSDLYRPVRIVTAFHVFVEFRTVHMLRVSVEAIRDGYRYRSTFVKSVGRGPLRTFHT